LGLSIGGENKSAIKKAVDIFNKANLEDLPSEQRGLIISTAVRWKSSNKLIDDLIKEYKSSQNPDIQMSIAAALTHTKDPKIANRLLEEGLGAEGFVRMQDIFRWFAYLMRNRHTRDLAWDWLTSSWQRLEKDFGGGKSLDHFVVYSAAPLHDKKWQKKFKNFWEPKREQIALKRNITVALSEIDSRTTWYNRDLPKLTEYFSNNA
jgi:aminopeptidase N